MNRTTWLAAVTTAAAGDVTCPVKMETAWLMPSTYISRGTRSGVFDNIQSLIQDWSVYDPSFKWAMVEYSDKGLPTAGSFEGRKRDECRRFMDSVYNVRQAMTEDSVAFRNPFRKPEKEGSQGWRLNVVEALFHATVDPDIGWTPRHWGKGEFIGDRKLARTVVLYAMDMYREEGEGQELVEWYNAAPNASQFGGFGNPAMGDLDGDWLFLTERSFVKDHNVSYWEETGKYSYSNYVVLANLMTKQVNGETLSDDELAQIKTLQEVFSPIHFDDLKPFDYKWHGNDPQTISTTMDYPSLKELGPFLTENRILPLILVNTDSVSDSTKKICIEKYDLNPEPISIGDNPNGTECLFRWYNEKFAEAGIEHYHVAKLVNAMDMDIELPDLFIEPLNIHCAWPVDDTTTSTTEEVVSTTQNKDDDNTTPASAPDNDETTTEGEKSAAGVIAGAAVGGAAAVAAAGALLWKKFGMMNKLPVDNLAPSDQMEVTHITEERETMENVTMEMFR